jgi:hypothetical protein
MQLVEHRVNLEKQQILRPRLKGLPQPDEREVLLFKTSIDLCDAIEGGLLRIEV